MVIFEDTRVLSNNQPSSKRHISLMKDPTNHFDYFLIDCFSVILYVYYFSFQYPVWTWGRRYTEACWAMIFFVITSYVSYSCNLAFERPSVTKVIDIPVSYSPDSGYFRISYITFLNFLRFLTCLFCNGNRQYLRSKTHLLPTLKYT